MQTKKIPGNTINCLFEYRCEMQINFNLKLNDAHRLNKHLLMLKQYIIMIDEMQYL